MFPRPLSQCSNPKRPQFYQNQHHFVGRLPIDFFYFADFRWSFFGKIFRQKTCFESAFIGSSSLQKLGELFLFVFCDFLSNFSICKF